MEIFFGGVFIDRETLHNAGINYPIKLEYYKQINEDELTQIDKTKYGINIVKTEYRKTGVKVEKNAIRYLTNDEKTTDFLLRKLKENTVTPIGLKDVINEFSRQIL